MGEKVEVVLIVSKGEGTRLDRWLSRRLTDISRSQIQRLIEQGYVQIDRQICQSKKEIVQLGHEICLQIPPPQPLDLKPEPIPLDILYEDDNLLIVNKQAGLVVHPAPGHPDGTLVNALLARRTMLASIGGIQRPGIVHRLDKDTSGAIAIAKTDQAHQHLQAQIQAKTAQRRYLVFVHGCPHCESGTIDLPIGRHPGDRKKMAIVSEDKGGRPAITHWKLQERLGNYTLLQCQLETGRTHQIRVHLAYLGHPAIGDPLYSAGRSIGVNLTGQALHAQQLRLQHPLSEEWIDAIAPLPEELKTLLTVLRLRSPSPKPTSDLIL